MTAPHAPSAAKTSRPARTKARRKATAAEVAARRRRAALADPHTSSPESEKTQDDNKPPAP